jgi:hypothetical protein
MLSHSLDLLQKLELFFEFKVVDPGIKLTGSPNRRKAIFLSPSQCKLTVSLW